MSEEDDFFDRFLEDPDHDILEDEVIADEELDIAQEVEGEV